MANPAFTSEVLPRPPSRLSPWLGVLVVVVSLVAALTILLGLGYLLWQVFVTPYRQILVTDVAPLGPTIGGCQPQIQIEHPAWLSLDDRGAQPAKYILLTLNCMGTLSQTVPITFEIEADRPGWIRLLNAEGGNARRTLVAQVSPDGLDSIYLYPECVNQPAMRSLPLTFTVSTIPANKPSVSFTIGLESQARTFMRHVITGALGPLSVGQLTLLGSLVTILLGWLRAWNEKQRKFGELYTEMQSRQGDTAALRELYPRYRELQGVFPFHTAPIVRHRAIELLMRNVEAGECLRRAIAGLADGDLKRAQEYCHTLSKWDPTHWAILVLECLVNLLQEKHGPDSTTEFEPQECLERLREGWRKADDLPRLRRQMVRGLSCTHLPDARKFLETVDDSDQNVRIEIAWALSGQERSLHLDQRLQRLIAAPLDEWLQFQEVHDPFGTAVAESADPAAEPFIWEHPLYEQLYPPAATIVLAPGGGGKTTARLALKRRFWGTSSAVFVLEYTDFHRLVAHPERISAYRHVAEILCCAARAVATLLIDDPERLDAVQDPYARRLIHSLLTNHLFAPHLVEQLKATLEEKVPSPDGKPSNLLSGRSPGDIMRDVVTIVQALGFDELYLLVDGLNNLPETRNLDVAEALLRHLVNDSAFLDVPHLRVKLFLPDRWEPLVADCEGVRSGRIHLLRLQWDGESLLEMLRMRLQVAGVESLNRLAVEEIYPSELDKALAREAEGSPRRLIELGKALLCLRALGWEESGRDPSEARLRTEDWATMLEYGLRRAAGG